MIPIAKHFDPVLGIDIHILTIPPVGPVPIPHPHIGIVFDPIDYVPILGSTIKVNGVPRATAGTSGKAIPHIPLGGPFAMPPGNEDEIFMGSTTVRADEAPLSFGALPVLSCQSVGMMAPIRKKPKKTFGMTLPTTIVMPIPAGMPVLVGGPPTIDVVGAGMALGLAGLGKAFKKFKSSKLGKKLGAKFKKAKQKACKNMKPGFLKCKVLRAEPVNSITGEVVVEQSDVTIEGRIPIEWSRYYGSLSNYRGACGSGWQTPADMRLEIDADGQALFYEGGPGARIFPTLPADIARRDHGSDTGYSILEIVDGARLTLNSGVFTVSTKDGLHYQFVPTRADFQRRKIEPVSLPIAKIFDDYHHSLTFVRDRDGQLQRIEESSGRTIVATSRKGLIHQLELQGPDGARCLLVRYEYDLAGNLTAVYDALEQSYRFAYEKGRMVRHTDRNGLSFYYEYDSQGKCIHTYGDNGLYDYTFDYRPQATQITNSLGHTTTLAFDENQLPVRETDSLGEIACYEYDEAGRTVAIIGGGGQRTEYEYDELGNLLCLTRPDGTTLTTEYDHDANPVRLSDPNGSLWRQQWNDKHRLVRQVSPNGAVTEYQYDQLGQIVQVKDPNGGVTRYQYDIHGNLSAVIDALGNTMFFQCDIMGNTIRETTPGGRVTQYHYDAKFRLRTVVDPSSHHINCDYDGQDNLTHFQDQSGQVTRLEYAGLGELVRRINPDGTEVTYWRDTEEQLVAISNERGQTMRLLRDSRGRVVKEVDFWGNTTLYKYSGAGRLSKMQDPLGRITEYVTDPLGRLKQKILFDGTMEKFDYDANGNLVMHDNGQSTCIRQYDADNRLLTESSGSFAVTNEYDQNGNRIARHSGNGNTVRYEYDQTNRLQTVRINDAPPFRIVCNEDGFIVHETFANRFSRHYQYNCNGHLIRQRCHSTTATLADRRYEYDSVGNLTAKTEFNRGRSFFTFDPLGRISKYIDPRAKVKKYLYDPAGDLLQADHLHSPATGLRRSVYRETEYLFDVSGNLVEKNNTQQRLSLTWDGNNRLHTATAGDGTQTSYHYDALGRRTGKDNDKQSVQFFWDGDYLLGDSQAPGRCREFVYYPDTFQPLALIESDGEIYYYQNEINGAPLELLNSNGGVAWSGEYDPLGAVELAKHNQIDNPLRFQGQYFDEETGLHYNRFRHYDPAIGQFISQDPIGLMGGLQPYRYAPNTYNWIDPLGLSCKENAWNAFQKRSKGVFANSTQAAKGYKLWKKQDWAGLQRLLGPGSWPPNRGFVSVKSETLSPGTRIDRFGGFHDSSGNFRDRGGFVSPEGSTFSSRALPAGTKSKPYNAYEVTEPIEVDAGPAIPWFGEPGMGTQYELPQNIDTLMDEGKISRVSPLNDVGDL